MRRALLFSYLLFCFAGAAWAQSNVSHLIEKGNSLLFKTAYDSAQIYFSQAMDLFDSDVSDSLELAAIYYGLAEVAFRNSQYDDAFPHARESLAIRQYCSADAPTFEVVDSYTQVGRLYRRKGDYKQALTYHQQALELEQARPKIDPDRLSRSISDMGNIYRNLGEYEKALDYMNQSIALDTVTYGTSNHPEIAILFHNVGIIYSLMGDYDKAVRNTLRALKIRISAFGAVHIDVAKSYFMLGDYYRIKGYYDQALAYNEKSTAIWQEIYGPEHLDVASNYVLAGIICAEKGDYDCALSYSRRALSIQQKNLGEDHPQAAGTMGNIGYIYQLKGDNTAALWHNRKSLEMKIKRVGKLHPWVAETYRSLGRLYEEEGDYPGAIDMFEQAWAIDKTRLSDRHATMAENMRNLAGVYLRMGKAEKAIGLYEEALKGYQASFGEQHPYLGELFLGLADAWRLRQNWDAALEHVEEGFRAVGLGPPGGTGDRLPALTEVNAKPALRDLLLLGGTCYGQRYDSPQRKPDDLQNSLNLYLCAADLIDSIRVGFQYEGSKQLLAEKAIPVYEGGIAACYRLYAQDQDPQWLEQAFGLAERSKATLLYESMQESQARRFSGLPESVLSREQQLRRDLSFYKKSIFEETQLGADAEKAKIALWEARGFATKQSYDSLLIRLEIDYPAYHQLKYSLQVPNIISVQSLLPDDSVAFVEYFVGGEAIYAFVFHRESADMVQLARPADLDSLVIRMRKGMEADFFSHQGAGQQPGGGGYETHALLLYQQLLAPLREMPAGLPARLIVVPDGVLGYLPFDALLTAEPAAIGKYKFYPYLIRDHQVAYAYAARLLTEQRLQPARQHSRKGWVAFAPMFAAQEPQLATMPVMRDDFGFLAYSKPEVEGIRDLIGGDAFLDDRATEDNFKHYAPQYRVIHISSHAKVNDANPLYSRIAFATAKDSAEDGFLEVAELFDMELHADMVVLSACETGSGTLYRGEGIVSLARGFTYAGARSILTTLWSVNDAATSDIMQRFYRYLNTGKSKDQALRLAKQDYIAAQDNLGAHPFYWSGYVMMGNMVPLELASEGITGWERWMLMVLFVSGGAALVLRRHMRMRT